MRNMKWKSVLVAFSVSIAACGVLAQGEKKEEPQGMPPMGPPEEMKQCANLVGDWDAATKFKMSPTDTNWMESKATAVYKYVLDGAMLEMSYEQMMMGQKFSGGGWQAYDRETKQWQMTWADNMSARITLYTGTMDKSGSVFTGEDRMMGQVTTARISTSNHTADSFDWKGETSSDGGKTWWTWGTAKYTKRK